MNTFCFQLQDCSSNESTGQSIVYGASEVPLLAANRRCMYHSEKSSGLKNPCFGSVKAIREQSAELE
jgi:hypothetical protein